MGEKQGCALSVMLAAVLALGIASPVSASLPTSPETTPPISAASQFLDAVPPALPSPFAASLEMPSLSPGARICWPRTPTGPRSYLGARYHRAGHGRFTTVDPVYTWRDNLVDPQRWNRYAYGRNNPFRCVDPDGRAIDVLVDIGFIGYDVFDIGRSAYRGEGVSGTQILALGGDIVGAVIPFATGIGAAIRAGSKVERAVEAGRAATNIIDGSKAIAREGIYEFPDAVSAGKTYVGQSSNVPRRIGQHERSGKKAADATASTTGVSGGKTAREAAEQRRINQLGGTRDAAGSQTSNVRNPIGEGRRAAVEKKYGPLDR